MKQPNKQHRIFLNKPIKIKEEIDISNEALHHMQNVLRIKKSEEIVVFNGDGKEFKGFLIKGTQMKIQITELLREVNPPKKKIILAQCISSSRHMDFAIQKSVEIGIHLIIPIISIRSHPGNHLKKIEHWKKIIIHATEQSHGLFIPEIYEAMDLKKFLNYQIFKNFYKVMLHQPGRKITKKDSGFNEIIILVGPEGGFDYREIEDARKENWNIISLGDRILRTETAAIVAHTLLEDF
ncbi:MAG: 16S rRNA (uracil(1498)-N(3))-methyltransferase [Pseudomonadota bacterium]|nr:16S rRNA (uracil(1498)-N(3))-methyltransferase [Pseudomonadota bacterium]